MDSDCIYWTSQGTLRRRTEQHLTSTVTSSQATPTSLAVDAERLYWVGYDDGTVTWIAR